MRNFTFILLLLTGLMACSGNRPVSNGDSPNVEGTTGGDGLLGKAAEVFSFTDIADLEEIIERDTLKAITTYSSTSYFLYRGQPMGYEYELAKRLAEHLDVELKMIVADNIDDIIDLLRQGKGDIVMHNLTVTKSRLEEVDFTLPLNFTHQVLVQRKPANWRNMKLHNIDKQLLRNPIKLIGKEIHVRENSSYNDRIQNLEEELGGDIVVKYVDGNSSTDDIIERVSNGEIDYTIADYNIANIQAGYYNNIDIQTTIGVMQRLAWAVNKESPNLLAAVNEWLEEQRTNSEFFVIYNKYFKNKRAFASRAKSDDFSLNSDQLSKYDDLMKETAQQISWDWRFLASQVYQESNFDPKEKSWAGAVGLMQLMPKTAKSYGVTQLTKPTENLEAGAAHLEFLNNYWMKHIADSTERLKFVLASYNAGHAHVQDARRLAEKQGLNSDIWYGNVEQAMLLKSDKKYYNDPVVKYGYCRGTEPVNYVKEIFERYNYYAEFIPEITEDEPYELASGM
ncbi:MAG: transporter substrate-binding domain-containing protein [Cyclobacteriaceae bacterium]